MDADRVRLALPGAAVVVTGAGSGIGAALATRFAAEGARVLVNDVDADAARAVAARTGGEVFPADMADPAAVAALVRYARERFGGIDLFCANAGVPGTGGLDATDETWEHAWRVNTMSPVYAARELLPDWLAAGRGRLLVTASAAGLLTLLGAAPYSVTKHAAVAFVEWLRASYAHRGVVVQALCPQGSARRCWSRARARVPPCSRPGRSPRSRSPSWWWQRWPTTGSWCCRIRRWRRTTPDGRRIRSAGCTG
ncbi:hypothetical protein GCM10027615_59140 [Plantactinospora veratri]